MTRSILAAAILAAAVLSAPVACGSDDKGADTASTPPDVPTQNDTSGGRDPATAPDDGAAPQPELPPPPDCGTTVGTTKMGFGCEEDCDCEPGLICYDEAYPGAKGVCTRDGGNCGAGFQYIQFSSTHWNKYKDMTLKNLCVPACESLADCDRYGGIYAHCADKSGSYWEGQTLALKGHCQVTKTE
ncbi:MAG: hypothetical protein FJ087_20565 [Deltaproteobacteria bacterium]|nr:hypothetical protein [Deltaproteobacteria bacterium]